MTYLPEISDETQSETVNVLLVDDLPDNLLALEVLLEKPSLNLVSVTSGLEALEALKKEKFALVLLDVDMPGMDGLETARQIRMGEANSHVPIIFATAMGVKRDFVLESYSAGAVDLLVKPLEPSILKSKVDVFVSLYRHEMKLEQAIRAQLEMKDRFLSQVSHELRTPLNALCQFLHIVESGMAGDLTDDQRQYLAIASRNAGNLKELVSDLVDVMRAQNNKLKISPQCISFRDLLEEIRPELDEDARTKSNQFSIHIEEDLPFLWADPGRIRQVIVNLCSNAMKFGPQGMLVSLMARRSSDSPGMVQIEIHDEGCGIEEDKLKTIFDPLYQLETPSVEDCRRGLGLGLFICQELVSQHGGRIWAHSELGKGSQFCFTLPCFSLEAVQASLGGEEGGLSSLSLLTFRVEGEMNGDEGKIQSGLRRLVERCTGPHRGILLPANLLKSRQRALSCLLFQASGPEVDGVCDRIRDEWKASSELKGYRFDLEALHGDQVSVELAG